ncbi:MAG: ABC-2 family transporter protein [Lentisphaeria bacterium]|jgi:ABC-2 type transport system permease protein
MRLLRQLRILTGVQYAYMLEYRAELYLWVLSGVMPFFLMGLWMEAGRLAAAAPAAALADPARFARYFLAVFLVRQITLVWVIYDVEDDVVKGRLSPQLLQPLNPFWRYLASHLGERLARLPFLAILTLGVFWLVPTSRFPWEPARLPVAAAMLAAAFLLRFVMQYCFAMLAFWTERANAIDDLSFLLYLFLSGFLAPLDLFPATVREFATWTPFPYLVYLPAELLAGAIPPGLGRGCLVMAAWLALFTALALLLWRRGLRRYSAMGA